MKKRLSAVVALMLCVALLMCGCDSMFISDDFRRMNDMYVNGENGISLNKQEVFNKLGYPDGYTDESGESYVLYYGEQENMNEELFQASITGWSYTCQKYSDSDPYTLTLTFDSSGNSTKMTFAYIPEG